MLLEPRVALAQIVFRACVGTQYQVCAEISGLLERRFEYMLRRRFERVLERKGSGSENPGKV